MTRQAPKNLSPVWTWQEDEVIRECYLIHGAARCQSALPGRTVVAVMHRAAKLGYTTRRRWTEEDDALLRSEWGNGWALSTVAKRLKRTEKTTYWRARKLKLPMGVPQGYEAWTAAAKRTGYCTSQLWRICHWGGVEVHCVCARPSKPRGGGSKHAHYQRFVDGFDLDEAIARWLKTETVEHAARRIGVCGDTVRRWLAEEGLQRPTESRVHWRVESETFDRIATMKLAVLYKHRKRLAAAAAQLEMAS